jgi:hypothetical protein
MVDGRDGFVEDHGFRVKVTLLLLEKKGASAVKLTSA